MTSTTTTQANGTTSQQSTSSASSQQQHQANLATAEDIVKYQQELMNFQRNQREVQKETIKLLHTLNKTLSLMLERLDEFAIKTNIKLEESSTSTTNTTTNRNQNSSTTSSAAASSSTSSDPVCSMTADSIAHSLSSLCNSVSTTLSNLSNCTNANWNGGSNATVTNTTNNGSHLLNKNELIFLNDLSTSTPNSANNFMDTTSNNTSQLISHGQLFLNSNHLNTNTSSNHFNSPLSSKGSPSARSKEEENNQQRFFNKFVRESVEKRLGKDFLLFHEIQEIDQNIMEEIKREALQAYPPVHIRPRRAWHLAKASLRCRRRSLKRQKEKTQVSSTTSTNSGTKSTSIKPTGSSPTSTTINNNNTSNNLTGMI